MSDENGTPETGSAIAGVHVVPLRRICDERGAIFHMLRSDSPLFERFGEAARVRASARSTSVMFSASVA